RLRLYREPHQSQRLAISLRMGAAEIALHVLFCVAAFLVRDDDTAVRSQFRQAARHRLVVAVDAIAMQLDPVRETARDIIERERSLDVPGELDPLPRREVVVNLPAGFADLGLHRLDLGIEIEIVPIGMVFQVLEPALQFQDRFFEFARMRFPRRNSDGQSVMVTAVLLFTRLLSSSMSLAGRPRPGGGGWPDSSRCPGSGTAKRK